MSTCSAEHGLCRSPAAVWLIFTLVFKRDDRCFSASACEACIDDSDGTEVAAVERYMVREVRAGERAIGIQSLWESRQVR